jgi:predicted metal-dependent hydrolase
VYYTAAKSEIGSYSSASDAAVQLFLVAIEDEGLSYVIGVGPF